MVTPPTLLDLYYAGLEDWFEAPAVLTRLATHTFRQLEDRSNAIAAALRRRGVGPGARVALMLPRGFEFLAAILGVMKTRAAYAPFDASLPQARLDYLLSHLEPQLCVTATADPRPGTVAVSDLDEAGERILPPVEPEAPAYIIYTSGSSGTPKGVVISHGALAHFSAWCLEALGRHRGRPMLNVASFSFDQSVLDFVMLFALRCPLAVSAERGGPFDLAADMARHRIELVSTVPNTFSILLSFGKALGRFDLSALRCVILGGAAFPETLREKLFGWKPDLEVLNLYGPTEATVYCTAQAVTPDQSWPQGSVPLGTALPHTEVFLLDPGDRLVPPGPGRGELVIAGPQVMTEYHRDPERTAASRATGCAELRGRRLYRTGDVVERDGEGRLFFLGRADDQVKTSGYRISLLEVEHALLQLPGVRQAAVVAVPDPDVENRLYGFLSGAADVTPERALEGLRGLLPAYMLPRRVEVLAALPLNTSGKIDKLRLKELAREQSGPHHP